MAWTRTYNEPEPQRVNKWLAQSGVCSRREAEALIGKGLVFIDGQRVDDAGRKIETGQTLVLNDNAQAILDTMLSVVFHKPIGIVSSLPQDDQVEAASLLTKDALWGVTHFGRRSFDFLAAAIGMGADLVRIGFEDSKFIDAEQRAENNLQLVEKLATLIRAMDREIATPDEARRILDEMRDYLGKFWLVKPKAASLESLAETLRSAA